VTTPAYRRARHSVSALHAHLVFVTKYRRPVFTNEMLTFCQTTMRVVCDELGVELVEFNGEADHVNLLVQYPPRAGDLHPRAKAQRPHRLRGTPRVHRHLCPRPHARTPLVALVLRRLLRRGTPVDHQANTSTAKHGHFECRAAPGDRRDGLTPAEACAQEIPVKGSRNWAGRFRRPRSLRDSIVTELLSSSCRFFLCQFS